MVVDLDSIPEITAAKAPDLDTIPEMRSQDVDHIPEIKQVDNLDHIPEIKTPDTSAGFENLSDAEKESQMKDQYDKYWSGKKQELTDPNKSFLRKAGTVAMTGLEGIAFPWTKVVEPTVAGLSAAQQGKDVAGAVDKELLLGSGENANLVPNMKPGISSTLINIGGRLVGPGGAVKGAGKLAEIGEVPGLMETGQVLQKIGKGIQDVENSGNILAKPIASIFGKVAGKIPEAINNAAKDNPVVAKLAQTFISPIMGAGEDVRAAVEQFKQTHSALSGRIAGMMQPFTNKLAGLRNDAERSLQDIEDGQAIVNRKTLQEAGAPIEPHQQVLFNQVDALNEQMKQTAQQIKDNFTAAGQKAGMDADSIQASNVSKYVENLTKESSQTHTPAKYGIDPLATLKDPEKAAAVASKYDETLQNIGKRLENARAGKSAEDAEELARTYAIGQRFKEFYADAATNGSETAIKNLEGKVKDDPLQGVVRSLFEKPSLQKDTAEAKNALSINGGFMQPKNIPSELLSVFNPTYRASDIMGAYSHNAKQLAMLHGMSTLAAENPGRMSKMAETLDEIWKDHPTDIDGKADVIFKGMKDYFPSLYGTGADSDFLRRFMVDGDKVYRDGKGILGKLYPVWKNMVLRSTQAITRNFLWEYGARGAHYGIEFPDYLTGIRDVENLYRGKGLQEFADYKHLAPDDYRRVENTLYSLIGGNESSFFDKMKQLAILKPTEETAQTMSPTAIGKAKEMASTVWDKMGNYFRAPNDSLRIRIFQKGLREAAPGLPFEEALKNPDAVKQAYSYMNEHTINYDNLPGVAQTLKMISPFFAFSFRAPRQVAKAFIENPAIAAKMKLAPQVVSNMNMQKEDPQFKKMWESRQNPTDELVNPFGAGNIFVAKNNNPGGTDSIRTINPSSYDIFGVEPGKENYDITDTDAIVKTLMKMSGLAGNSPIATALGAGKDWITDDKQKAISELVRTFTTPAELQGLFKAVLASRTVQNAAATKTPVGDVAEFLRNIYSHDQYLTPGEAAAKQFGITTKDQTLPSFYQEPQTEAQKIQTGLKKMIKNRMEVTTGGAPSPTLQPGYFDQDISNALQKIGRITKGL